MRRVIFLITYAAFLALALTGCRKVSVPSGTIVFLGDSITAGYGLDPSQAYPALLEIRGMTMVNLGVSGSKTDDGVQRLRDYFNGGGKARLVVIALGANDILQGIPAKTIEANLQRAVEECRRHGASVMLYGIKIPGKFGTSAIFETVANNNHLSLIPDLLQCDQFQENLMQEDHMHPTAEGQKLIAEKMQAAPC